MIMEMEITMVDKINGDEDLCLMLDHTESFVMIFFILLLRATLEVERSLVNFKFTCPPD
jgi:hypothetical protein